MPPTSPARSFTSTAARSSTGSIGRGQLIGISLLWLGLSALGDGVTTLLLPLRLDGLSGARDAATTLGLLTFVGLGLATLIQPFAGAWSDRLGHGGRGRRPVLLLGVTLALAGLVLLALGQGLAQLAIAYAVIVVGANVAQAAQQGLIPDLVPSRLRGRASGLKGFMDLMGALLAFAIVGLLATSGVTVAVGALAAILVATLLLTLVTVRDDASALPEVREAAGAGKPNPETQAGRRRLATGLDRQALAATIGARFLFLFGTYAVGRYLLLFVAEQRGLPTSEAVSDTATLLVGLALISAVAAPLSGWAADRFGRSALMVFGAGLSAAGALLLLAASTVTLILVFGALMAVGSAAFTTANWAVTADLAPHSEGGRVFGLANLGTTGAAAAAGLAGPVVDAGRAMGMGFAGLFMLSAVAFVASAALALRLTPSHGAMGAAFDAPA